MKGMRKISRGSGFAGVIRYVFSGDNEKRPTPGKLLGGSFGSSMRPNDLTKQFEAISAIKPSIKKAVWHNSLRLPKGEAVSDGKWVEIGDEYMRRMGFSEGHPRIYVIHDDYEGQHIHIVASRVAADATVFYGQNENLISTRVIAGLEKQFSLTITKGVDLDEEGRIVMPDVKPLRRGEIEKAVRTGEKPVRMILQEAVDAALAGKPTTTAFIERLERVGIEVKTSFKGDEFNGFAFGYAGLHFSASEIGDKYKLSRLKKRLNHDETRDYPALDQRRSQRSNNSRQPQRSDRSAPEHGVGSSPGGSTAGAGARAATPDDAENGKADRADRAPDFSEAVSTLTRISKPTNAWWRVRYEADRRRLRAKLDREKRDADEEYERMQEWARQQRLALAKQRRPVRFAIVVAEPAGWRYWRKKQMVREYGRASELLALFFVSRDKRRREIAYEYAGARIVDRGTVITADHGSYAEIDAMLELAKLKNWGAVKFFGSEEFKAEAMRMAMIRGFKVAATPGDEALLDLIKAQVRAERAPGEGAGPRFSPPVPRPRGFTPT